jgi:hypothetical protein
VAGFRSVAAGLAHRPDICEHASGDQARTKHAGGWESTNHLAKRQTAGGDNPGKAPEPMWKFAAREPPPSARNHQQWTDGQTCREERGRDRWSVGTQDDHDICDQQSQTYSQRKLERASWPGSVVAVVIS